MAATPETLDDGRASSRTACAVTPPPWRPCDRIDLRELVRGKGFRQISGASGGGNSTQARVALQDLADGLLETFDVREAQRGGRFLVAVDDGPEQGDVLADVVGDVGQPIQEEAPDSGGV